MHITRRLAAAIAAACLATCLATSALADTSPVNMNGTWQKVGSAGAAVDVQNITVLPIVITTATGAPAAGSSAGHVLTANEHRCMTLQADLYAKGPSSAQLQVMGQVSCAGAPSGGGSSTANQGAAGGSPWPVSVTGGATAAKQDTLDADLKATQPRSIASNAPSVGQSGSLSAIGDTVQLAVDGMNTVTLQLPVGAWSGTLAVDASADGGATWTQGLNVIPYSGGAAAGSLAAGGLWEMAVGGLTTVRLRAVTTITGGPITAALRATNGLKSIRVGNPSGNPLTVTDPNSASYSSAGTAVASGTLPLPSGVTVPRGVNAVCPTGGGALTTFTLAGGGSVQKYIAPAPGSQDFGLAAITATAVTGCTFQAIY